MIPSRFQFSPRAHGAVHRGLRSALCAGLLAAVSVGGLSACSSSKSGAAPPPNPFAAELPSRLKRLDADQAYKTARRSLESADYNGAIAQYRAIQLRFPFTTYATQAKLEIIFAEYKSFALEAALSAADRFIKEHPRHPDIDYVRYIRGLANYRLASVDGGDWWGLSEPAEYDTIYVRRAFDAFQQLSLRHPDSKYVPDALKRMVFLRDNLAKHDLAIADYYLSRQAYVAASRRAERILERFQGSSVIPQALAVLEKSYAGLGLDDLSRNARALAVANFGKSLVSPAPVSDTLDAPPSLEDRLRVDEMTRGT